MSLEATSAAQLNSLIANRPNRTLGLRDSVEALGRLSGRLRVAQRLPMTEVLG